MQDVIQEFTIGFFDSSGVFSIYMKQDDTDRVIKFHIMDSAEDYREFLSNPHLIITVREQLPSGDMLPDIPIDKQDLDLETMSLTIHVTKAMLQQCGIANCELMFSSTEDGLIITTVPFKLIIEESFMTIPNDSTQIEFDNWTELYIALRSMQDQVESGEEIRVENENERISQENARQAAEVEREHAVGDQVKQAEAWAKGTRDGIPVTSSDETYENNAKYYAIDSRDSSIISGSFMRMAGKHAEDSEAYAIGKRNGIDVPSTDETYQNNSKYYRDQAASIMAELDGTIRAQGTCTFAELPNVSDARPGDMWNVSDEFVTTDDFKEGAGKTITEGANVYMTVSSKWDIMAGAPVSGVKGAAETNYRKGNVNLTSANIGAVGLTGNDTVAGQKTFTARPIVDLSGATLAAQTVANILTYKYKNAEGQVKTVNVIRTYGDSETAANNGTALIGSSSGQTVVTSGEGANSLLPTLSEFDTTNEQLYLMSDNAINFYVGCNTTANAKKAISIASNGNVTLDAATKSSMQNQMDLSAAYNSKTIPFRFGIDANGNYGYYKDGADTVTPFKTGINSKIIDQRIVGGSIESEKMYSRNITINDDYQYVDIVLVAFSGGTLSYNKNAVISVNTTNFVLDSEIKNSNDSAGPDANDYLAYRYYIGHISNPINGQLITIQFHADDLFIRIIGYY